MYELTCHFPKQILIKRSLLFTELCTVKIARFQSVRLYEIFNRDNRYYIDRIEVMKPHRNFKNIFDSACDSWSTALDLSPAFLPLPSGNFHLSAPLFRSPLCLFWTTTYLFYSSYNILAGGKFSYNTTNNDFPVSWLVQTSERDWPSLCVRCFTNYKTIGSSFKPVAAERPCHYQLKVRTNHT